MCDILSGGSRDVWRSVTEGWGGKNWPKIVWHTLWTAPKWRKHGRSQLLGGHAPGLHHKVYAYVIRYGWFESAAMLHVYFINLYMFHWILLDLLTNSTYISTYLHTHKNTHAYSNSHRFLPAISQKKSISQGKFPKNFGFFQVILQKSFDFSS